MRHEDLEIAWAGGLFEGEGNFTLNTSGKYHYPRAKITSTDLDVLERFQRAVGGMGSITGPYRPRVAGNKDYWHWTATRTAEVVRLVEVLHPYLGARRCARADEVLASRVGSNHFNSRPKAVRSAA